MSLFHESFASVCGHSMLSLLVMLGFILVLGVNRLEREAIVRIVNEFVS